MCEPMRTAQSFGDDAHAVAIGLHLGMSGLHSVVWSVSVGGKPGSPMGARTRTRAMLNVRQRPLVVNANKRNPKEQHTCLTPNHAHTQNRQPSQSPNALNSPNTHAVKLATLKRSLLDAVNHFLFPTSLFLSVFLHVCALSSSLGMNILLNAFPLSSSSTPPLSSSLTFISSAFPS